MIKCEETYKGRRWTQEKFEIEAKKVHGDLYDYSSSEFINERTKIYIKCIFHNYIFKQEPRAHIHLGIGCPKCGEDRRLKKRTKSFSDFLEQANSIHNNKFLYKESTYKNSKTKIIIICPKHGEFKQAPYEHLVSIYGCMQCAIESSLSSHESFLESATKIHNRKYEYPNRYHKVTEKLSIYCPVHDYLFMQTPNRHLAGQGCPKCGKFISKGIIGIEKYLKSKNIFFIREHIFKDYRNPTTGGWLIYDFWIPSLNLLIEYDGIQHFRPAPWFTGGNMEKAIKNYEDQVQRDGAKNIYCLKTNKNLLRISHKELKNIDDILDKEIERIITLNS